MPDFAPTPSYPPQHDGPIGEPGDGFRGVWYQNTTMDNEFVFKYSGGLGTYCAKHQPFAVYRPEVNMTFFCYGGVPEGYHTAFELGERGIDGRHVVGGLEHMVSAYDHATGELLRPTRLLKKDTLDAHDNPVISVDDDGYIWILSTSHGQTRPSHIHRSLEPYRIDRFERVAPTRQTPEGEVAIDNFSYMQAWNRPGRGFAYFFTAYANWERRTFFASSRDGVHWSDFQALAHIAKGHYQISVVEGDVAACAFNYHPPVGGLEKRTNLYYMQTGDEGKTWQNVQGETLTGLPLTEPLNGALVHHFEAEGRLVYMKDIRLDALGRPLILFLTTHGHITGPVSGPRTWQLARWTGDAWRITPIVEVDSNYDTGSLYLLPDSGLRVIGPSGVGPQPGNPGGEVEAWISDDDGVTWRRERRLTAGSARNHTYVRRPLHAAPGFVALWADGNGRAPSESDLYFCDDTGQVYRMPRHMTTDRARPEALPRPPAE